MPKKSRLGFRNSATNDLTQWGPEIVEDLLNSAEELVHVDNVLMDREFDSQHILEMISQRGLPYVVPKRMQTSEKAQAKRLLQRDQDRYETDRKLHLRKNE